MCSVVGYVGKYKSQSFVMEGLRRLEYRGYDSAGFACLDVTTNRILHAKAEGRLENLIQVIHNSPEAIDGRVSIGHTRWATHGVPSYINAHPQFDVHKKIALVHNGIVENCYELKATLIEQGIIFCSQTDTEVIVHLFSLLLHQEKSLFLATKRLVSTLQGSYSFIAIMEEFPNQVIIVRKKSPLCIGLGIGEMFIASDCAAFAEKTDKIVFLPDESFAFVSSHTIQLYSFTGEPLDTNPKTLVFDGDLGERKEYKHYMLKEIYEQKNAIKNTLSYLSSLGNDLFNELGLTIDDMKRISSISFIACGTSWNASSIAQFYFEEICGIPTQVHLASEFRYKSFFPDSNCLYITVSQSGETADTLEALRLINSMNLKLIAISNVALSTMIQEARGHLFTRAGREVAVASTKAFTAQLVVLYWLAHKIALIRSNNLGLTAMDKIEQELVMAGTFLEDSIEKYKHAIEWVHAASYAQYKTAIFLGRHASYPLASEAALKLNELAYIFSQSYAAGELKHGPLALIDYSTPIFIFSSSHNLIYQKLLSNAQEVKARGGHIIAFACEGQYELQNLADITFSFPYVNHLLDPLIMAGVMQFFVYAVAKQLQRPIDNPRNLAKSVTVE